MTQITPQFELRVNSVAIDESIKKLIESVVFEDNLFLADKISLGISDPTKELVDNKIFAEGNILQLLMGYDGDLVEMQAGVINSIKPSFPENGIPSLTIEALDGSMLMMDTAKHPNKKRSGFNFVGQSDSSIFNLKMSLWNFIGKSDSTVSVEPDTRRSQARDLSDYKFLAYLAELNGYEFFVDWDFTLGRWKGIFKKPSDKDAADFTLNYGQDASLISFNPEFALRGQSTEFEMAFFDKTQGTVKKLEEPIKVVENAEDVNFIKADRSEITEKLGSGGAIRLSAAGQAIEVSVNKAFKDNKAALAFARQWLKDRSQFFVTANGSCYGHPKIRAGRPQEIAGVGKRFGGKYYFTKTTHKMVKGSPYVIDFSARNVFASEILQG